MRLITMAALGGLFTTSCVLPGSARTVQRTQTGGVIALEGNHDTAMSNAHEAMVAHCGNYEIIEEREVVVGSNTASAGDASYTKRTASAHVSSQTRDATEYRITYQCTNGPAPAPAPTTQGGAPGQVPPAATGTN